MLPCISITGSATTSASTITAIDNAISAGASISITTHCMQDIVTSENNIATSVYTEVLDHIKEKVDAGLAEVITYRELYQRWCPNEYEEFMSVRHEKQFNYLLSKINP